MDKEIISYYRGTGARCAFADVYFENTLVFKVGHLPISVFGCQLSAPYRFAKYLYRITFGKRIYAIKSTFYYINSRYHMCEGIQHKCFNYSYINEWYRYLSKVHRDITSAKFYDCEHKMQTIYIRSLYCKYN